MTIQESRLIVDRQKFKFDTWASSWKTSTIWWITFALGCVLYGATAQTSIPWQDSARFQWRILTNDYFWPDGVAANAHPLLIVIGQIFKHIPVGDLFWRLNCISSLGMALAVANFNAVAMLLTSRRWVAMLVTAMFALSHMIWSLATITQTYPWNLVWMTLQLLLLIKLIREPSWSRLALLAFVSGLNLSLHGLALLMFPVEGLLALYLVFKRELPLWSIGVAAVTYCTGASLFIILVIKLAVSSGSIRFALFDAFFGLTYDMMTNTKFVTEYTIPNAAIASLSFVNVLLPLAVVGWFRSRKLLGNTTAIVLGAITFIDVIFVARLSAVEIWIFCLPAMTMISLAAAVGASYLIQLSAGWRRAIIILSIASIVAMPIFYGVLPDALRGLGIEVHRTRMLPFRDEMRYWINPWKQNENSAERFAEAALREAAPNGVIISDPTPFSVLLLARSMNQSYQGIGIRGASFGKVKWPGSPLPSYNKSPSEFRALLGDRPLFVVSPIFIEDEDIGILRDAKVEKLPGEVLYRVSWKKSGQGGEGY
jgi:hypothetical protein